MSLESFREETCAWLEENCPKSMRTPMPADEMPQPGRRATFKNPDSKLWLDRMAEKGWTVPHWPKEYGGGGLEVDELQILREEMERIKARTPLFGGMGVSMIGPALLEFGTEKQKKEHHFLVVRRIKIFSFMQCAWVKKGANDFLLKKKTEKLTSKIT